MLIAIEGVDGAGKRTLSEGLCKVLAGAGMSVATLAFPRYGRSVTADIAAEALHGQHGDLASSVYASSLKYGSCPSLLGSACAGDAKPVARATMTATTTPTNPRPTAGL